jgi:DNA invertase Pin-like site-specific DNA recombinase
MLIGYARLGLHYHDYDEQIDTLKRVGCRRLFTDYGDDADLTRPQAINALAALEPRDVLVVCRFDRLVGQSLPRLVDLADELRARGCGIRSLLEGVDTSSAEGRELLAWLASASQERFERELEAEGLKRRAS